MRTPAAPSALKINGTRYSLRGSRPNVGSAANRLGIVYGTSFLADDVVQAHTVSVVSPTYGTRPLYTTEGPTLTTDGDFLSLGTFRAQGANPGFWLDETGVGKGAYIVLDAGRLQLQRRGANFGAFEASPVRIDMAAPTFSLEMTSAGSILCPVSAVIANTFRASANLVEIQGGVSPQTLAVYGTYTSATNYERLRIYTQTGGDHVIASEAGAGGGTVRGILLSAKVGLGISPATYGKALSVLGNGVVVQGSGMTAGQSLASFFSNNITGDLRVIDAAISASGSLESVHSNSSTTGHARNVLRVAAAGSGDALTRWEINGGQVWSVGLDNSDGDKLKIAASGILGTSDRLAIDPTGPAVFSGGAGMFGVSPPTSQPAAPTDTAGLIALVKLYGMCVA